ncbi:glycosyl transferase family 1 [Thermotoga sp. RQ7]|uniref:tetratricopeptide repeat-containing glycosyltransferase family protein n=1 Tax=Thermotoga sp. RQ7 TaxID=126738 RepID=UPI0005A35223|nr:glycosyltransferase [Thermotoga sp. RQ7]AJG40024.1 glycosyl transferase family 1 [Thermotoga sp. RQ7]
MDIFEEIRKRIEQKEFSKAKELIEKIEDEVERYNSLGIIHYYEGKINEALEFFKKALDTNPVHDDVLFNYSKVLFEKEEYFESWRYLTRINSKTWEVYDMLGDTQLKQNNPAMALHYYKKAMELSNIPEMKEKYQILRDQFKKDIKLAIFCLPGLDNFIKDIAQILSNIYDVKLVVTTDGRQIKEAYDWADIVWLEWANEMAVEITNKLPKDEKKIICRLHRYEAFTPFVQKINWNNIDKLILVADHMKEVLEKYQSNIYKLIEDRIEVVPNGLDLNRFQFRVRRPGFNIAVVAHINHRKEPAMWLQVIGMLKKVDEKYTLHIAGDFQDPTYAHYFYYFIKNAGLEKNVKLYGWVDDVNAFLEDKNYLLSTSIHEGHPYNIAEAMARGIKPIIHNYAGAKTQWPEKLVYNFIFEIPNLLSEEYNSLSYRTYIEDSWAMERQILNISQLLKNKGG